MILSPYIVPYAGVPLTNPVGGVLRMFLDCHFWGRWAPEIGFSGVPVLPLTQISGVI